MFVTFKIGRRVSYHPTQSILPFANSQRIAALVQLGLDVIVGSMEAAAIKLGKHKYYNITV